jgi:peptidoglycan-binding protein CsiV
MQRVIVLLAMWFTLTPAFAATQGSATSANYDIEVLAFETQMPEFEGSELWTRAPRAADATAIAIESLPPSPDFATAINSMRNDGRFRVLLHKRWTQSAESKLGGPPVQLLSADSQLSGTLKFYLARFLHLELNVSYQPNSGAIGATPASDVTPSYVINEQRRVKSNELNYFDHPKFGVLVRVTPAAG